MSKEEEALRERVNAAQLAHPANHETRADEIESALRGILEIGKRDMSNPKYDGYFTRAREALESFTRAREALEIARPLTPEQKTKGLACKLAKEYQEMMAYDYRLNLLEVVLQRGLDTCLREAKLEVLELLDHTHGWKLEGLEPRIIGCWCGANLDGVDEFNEHLKKVVLERSGKQG